MQNQISVFQFQADQNVRVEIKNGEPWFCLKDVTEILNIEMRSTSKFNLKENGMVKIRLPSGGQNRELTFINEPNLYRVIFRSNKAEAVKFQDWIFEAVIPQIRKTGSYTVSDNPKKLSNKTTTTERTGLRNAVNLLVSKKGLNYSEAYSMVHQRFNVESIEDLSRSQLNEAVEYVHRVVLEGEVLDKEPLLSKSEFKALMHMFSKLCTYTMALRDLQNDLMLEERKLCYWFSRLNHAPEEGFFFFFKPNVNRDLDDAASLVHRYKKLIA